MRSSIGRARVTVVRGGHGDQRPDRLAAEEPMEIRVAGAGQEPTNVAVTMRTPGHDFELAAGFLLTEGLIGSPTEIRSVAYCDLPEAEQQYNVVTVRLTRAFDARLPERHFAATSSCGVCGKASLDQVKVHCSPLAPGPVVPPSVVASLPQRLRRAQRIFDQTGGLHAAGLFDPRGELLAVREDIGRHNAVDKVVGAAVLALDLPLSERILQVSGRIGFEIVQKAAVAGVPILSAVSAPSSLAVEAADDLGMTLLGFVRGSGFNVYTHPQRVTLSA
jgi:FdhD protein